MSMFLYRKISGSIYEIETSLNEPLSLHNVHWIYETRKSLVFGIQRLEESHFQISLLVST